LRENFGELIEQREFAAQLNEPTARMKFAQILSYTFVRSPLPRVAWRSVLAWEGSMTTYILLVNWTDQGIRDVKNTLDRVKSFRKTAQAMGITVDALKWTLGSHDLVVTVDAPDDETVTRLGMALGQLGNVRTTTMRAFGEDEMARILKGLP